MAEPVQPQVWERQPNEPRHMFAIFQIYRDLGPLRTIGGAVRVYIDTDLSEMPLSIPARARQLKTQQSYAKSKDPAQFVNAMAWHWKQQWGVKWHWEDRCDAYDAWNETLAAQRNQEDRIRQVEAEAEALTKWRASQLQAYVGDQTAAIAGVGRLLELVSQGLLRTMPWQTQKRVEMLREIGDDGKPTGKFVRQEIIEPGLAECLPLIQRILVEGRRLEDEHRGKIPATRLIVEGGTVGKLIELLQEFVPRERWVELADRLERLHQPAEAEEATR